MVKLRRATEEEVARINKLKAEQAKRLKEKKEGKE